MDSQSTGEPRVTPSPPPPGARAPGSLAAAAADRATLSNEGDDCVRRRLDYSGDSATPSDNDDDSAESSSDDSAEQRVHPSASKLPKRVTRATLEPPEAKRAKSVSLFDEYLASAQKTYDAGLYNESWDFLGKADKLPYEEGQARDEVFYLTARIMQKDEGSFEKNPAYIREMYENCLELNPEHQGAVSALSFLLQKDDIDGAIKYQERLVRLDEKSILRGGGGAQERLKQLKKKRAVRGGGGTRAATQPGGEARHETTRAPAAAPSLTNVRPTPPGHGVAPSELLPPAPVAAPPVAAPPAPPAASPPSPATPAAPRGGKKKPVDVRKKFGEDRSWKPFESQTAAANAHDGLTKPHISIMLNGNPALVPLHVREKYEVRWSTNDDDDDAMHDVGPPPRRAQAPEEEDESGPGGNTEEEEEEEDEDEDEEEDEEDDPEAEEDEPGTANRLILKEPSRRITTFDEMWAWIVHIITKSHDLKSTVHKGSFLEEVTQALFKEIYDTASSVRIVAASTNKTQGDDGRDIIVAFPKTAGLEKKIADCKNFKTAPATRPHVRSVVGSMMTDDKIVKEMRGTGILLTTTRFTGPAERCCAKYNKLWKTRSGFQVELWNLDRLKSELQEKFPGGDDEESALDTEETRNMVDRLLNRIVTNLREAKLAVFK